MLDIFAYFSVWIGIIFSVERWILLPIKCTARTRRQPLRISIADFFCLFITIQVPLGLTVWFNLNVLSSPLGTPEDPWEFVRRIATVFFIAGTLIWWGGVRAISSCGIYDRPRRILFLGLVVPTVCFGLVTFVLSVFACLAAVSAGDVFYLLSGGRRGGALTVIVGCALLACGILVHKVVLVDVSKVQAAEAPHSAETIR